MRDRQALQAYTMWIMHNSLPLYAESTHTNGYVSMHRTRIRRELRCESTIATGLCQASRCSQNPSRLLAVDTVPRDMGLARNIGSYVSSWVWSDSSHTGFEYIHRLWNLVYVNSPWHDGIVLCLSCSLPPRHVEDIMRAFVSRMGVSGVGTTST